MSTLKASGMVRFLVSRAVIGLIPGAGMWAVFGYLTQGAGLIG